MNAIDELNQLLGIGPPRPQLPVTLQRSGYTAVRALGKGSFGQAFLVFHKVKGKYFVMKHVNMSNMSSRQRKDAHNEIAILQQLHHPNIVRYAECFEEHPHLYIVMEYADGGDLYSHLCKITRLADPYQQRVAVRSPGNGLLTEAQAISLFVQTTMAVKYMHDRHILHRDIKSQNVFLTKNHVVKLGDFGITTVLQNTVAMASTMCGTPCYFSPELCLGKPYNSSSDIWALGVLLYELCAGRLPFESTTMKSLMKEIVNKEPARIPSGFSEPLWQLIQSMLRKDPKQRPTAGQVLRTPVLMQRIPDIIAQLQSASEVTAPPSPAAEDLPRRLRAASGDSTAAAGADAISSDEMQARIAPYRELLLGQQQTPPPQHQPSSSSPSPPSSARAGEKRKDEAGHPHLPIPSPPPRDSPARAAPLRGGGGAKSKPASPPKAKAHSGEHSSTPKGAAAGPAASPPSPPRSAAAPVASNKKPATAAVATPPPPLPPPSSSSGATSITDLLARFDREKQRIQEQRQSGGPGSHTSAKDTSPSPEKKDAPSPAKDAGQTPSPSAVGGGAGATPQVRPATPHDDLSVPSLRNGTNQSQKKGGGGRPHTPPAPPPRLSGSGEEGRAVAGLSPGAAAALAQQGATPPASATRDPSTAEDAAASGNLPSHKGSEQPAPALSSETEPPSELGQVLFEMTAHFHEFSRHAALAGAPTDRENGEADRSARGAAAAAGGGGGSGAAAPAGRHEVGEKEKDAASKKAVAGAADAFIAAIAKQTESPKAAVAPNDGLDEEAAFPDPMGAKLNVADLQQRPPANRGAGLNGLPAGSGEELLRSINTKFSGAAGRVYDSIRVIAGEDPALAAVNESLSAPLRSCTDSSNSPAHPCQATAPPPPSPPAATRSGDSPSPSSAAAGEKKATPTPAVEDSNACRSSVNGGAGRSSPHGAPSDVPPPPSSLPTAAAATAAAVPSKESRASPVDDDVPFHGECLCGDVQLDGWLSTVFGSLVCTCEACCRLSGSNVGVEWLHLPHCASPAELITAIASSPTKSSEKHGDCPSSSPSSSSPSTLPAGAGAAAAAALRKPDATAAEGTDSKAAVEGAVGGLRTFSFTLMVPEGVNAMEEVSSPSGRASSAADSDSRGALRDARAQTADVNSVAAVRAEGRREGRFIASFCARCGATIGLVHDELEGTLLAKTTLDKDSAMVLEEFAQPVVPDVTVL